MEGLDSAGACGDGSFRLYLTRKDLSSCHVSWIADGFLLQAEMVHTGLKLERALLVTASQCQQPAGVSKLLDGLVCSDTQGRLRNFHEVVTTCSNRPVILIVIYSHSVSHVLVGMCLG